jgi:hypothetical protein
VVFQLVGVSRDDGRGGRKASIGLKGSLKDKDDRES